LNGGVNERIEDFVDFCTRIPNTHSTSCCSSVLTTMSAPVGRVLCFLSVFIRHFLFCEPVPRRRGPSTGLW
jgi:hypothetical protein